MESMLNVVFHFFYPSTKIISFPFEISCHKDLNVLIHKKIIRPTFYLSYQGVYKIWNILMLPYSMIMSNKLWFIA